MICWEFKETKNIINLDYAGAVNLFYCGFLRKKKNDMHRQIYFLIILNINLHAMLMNLKNF